jgi:hypothetical protein
MGSIGFGKVKGVEAPGVSRTDFTGVIVLQASPFNLRGRGVELGADGRGG